MPVYRARVRVSGYVFVDVSAASTRDAHKKVQAQLRQDGPGEGAPVVIQECNVALEDVRLSPED